MRNTTTRTSHGGHVRLAYLLLAVLLAVGLLAATNVAQAKHAPQRRTGATHISQSPDDFVVLQLINVATAPIFVELDTENATAGTTEYAVPDGHVLVVTDVEWAGQFTTGAAILRIQLESRSDSTKKVPAFVSLGSVGNPGTGASCPLVTGFTVTPKVRLVAETKPAYAVTNQSTVVKFLAGEKTLIILRGYLTNADG